MNNLESTVYNSVKKKDNKNIILIMIIFTIAIILILIFGYIYLYTDTFKSAKSIFFEKLDDDFLIINSFEDRISKDFNEVIYSKNYYANGTYSVLGNLSENKNMIDVLNDQNIKFEESKDNINNKCEIKFEQKIKDKTTNIYYNYYDDKFNIKADGITQNYITINNSKINNLIDNLGLDGALVPSKLEWNYSKNNLAIILEDEFKNTLASIQKKSFQKVIDNNDNAIAIRITTTEFNNLLNTFVENLTKNQQLLNYLQSKNSSINSDYISNYSVYIIKKLNSEFNINDENCDIVVFETGDRKNTFEIRYSNKYIIKFAFKDEEISLSVNDKILKLSKHKDDSEKKCEYNLDGYIGQYKIVLNKIYNSQSDEQKTKNIYLKLEKDNQNAIYQINKNISLKDNIDVAQIDDENCIDISNYSKNELDNYISELENNSNNYYINLLNSCDINSSYNPLTISIPFVLFEFGIVKNDIAQFKLDNNEIVFDTPDQNGDDDNGNNNDDNNSNNDENNSEDKKISDEELENRNNDYKNYTYESQKYESINNLLNKIIENNKRYNDYNSTIDVFTYDVDNYEKNQGNLIKPEDDHVLFQLDESKMYNVYIYKNDNYISYIVIKEQDDEN